MSKEEFNDLVGFVTQDKYLKMDIGFEEKDEDSDITVWLAGDDEKYEGRFMKWYTNQHNCITVKIYKHSHLYQNEIH